MCSALGEVTKGSLSSHSGGPRSLQQDNCLAEEGFALHLIAGLSAFCCALQPAERQKLSNTLTFSVCPAVVLLGPVLGPRLAMVSSGPRAIHIYRKSKLLLGELCSDICSLPVLCKCTLFLRTPHKSTLISLLLHFTG